MPSAPRFPFKPFLCPLNEFFGRTVGNSSRNTQTSGSEIFLLVVLIVPCVSIREDAFAGLDIISEEHALVFLSHD